MTVTGSGETSPVPRGECRVEGDEKPNTQTKSLLSTKRRGGISSATTLCFHDALGAADGEDRGDHRCRAAVLHKHLFVLPKKLIKHFLDPERANLSPHSWEHMARGEPCFPRKPHTCMTDR